MNKQRSSFELLLNEKIIKILLGDKFLYFTTKYKFDVDSMPKLNNSDLQKISTQFGLNKKSQDREKYLSMIIMHCIKKERISDLLSYLFEKSQFSGKYLGSMPEQIEETYEKLVEEAILEINNILFFYDVKLIKIGEKYDIIQFKKQITVDAPNITIIDREYVSSMLQRALKDISDQDYDSCITKSRTLLEEVFCKIIEDKGEKPSDRGDIGKLYSQVKNLYNMHTNKDMDRCMNTLLSGLEKIVSSIAEIRNKAGDSHGVGANRIIILDYHARLVANSAATMAEFVYSVAENANKTNS